MQRVARLLLIALLLTLGLAGVAEASAPGAANPLASTRQVALGATMDPGDDLPTFNAFIAQVGQAPAIWSVPSEWGGSNKAFPDTALLDGLAAVGAVPLIVWSPVNPGNINSPAFTYSRILKGAWDTYIRGWAQAARAWGKTVLLRFAPEMDGYWFPWGMGRFDNTPKNFVAAWQRIWNIFRGPKGVGATNVKFVWSPNAPTPGSHYGPLYPGDRYVDYAAFSAFNWGGKRWHSMVDAYAPAMTAMAKVTKKPIIVAETGSAPNGGDKAAWIRNGYPQVYKKWPRIVAIVYFNVDTKPIGQANWLLTVPPTALTEYQKIAAQSIFQGHIQ